MADPRSFYLEMLVFPVELKADLFIFKQFLGRGGGRPEEEGLSICF